MEFNSNAGSSSSAIPLVSVSVHSVGIMQNIVRDLADSEARRLLAKTGGDVNRAIDEYFKAQKYSQKNLQGGGGAASVARTSTGGVFGGFLDLADSSDDDLETFSRASGGRKDSGRGKGKGKGKEKSKATTAKMKVENVVNLTDFPLTTNANNEDNDDDDDDDVIIVDRYICICIRWNLPLLRVTFKIVHSFFHPQIEMLRILCTLFYFSNLHIKVTFRTHITSSHCITDQIQSWAPRM